MHHVTPPTRPATQNQRHILRIAERGIIRDAGLAEEHRKISYTTSLLSLRSGTVLAGCQSGPGKHTPNNTILLARSRDGGRTWTPLPHQFPTVYQGIPGSLLCASMVEASPGRILLFTTWFDRSDPQRPLFDPTTEGLLRSRQLFCCSDDEGDTWTSWSEMQTPGLTGCAVSGPALHWSDGTIGVSFESFKEFDDLSPLQPAAWLNLSRDGGRTFERPRQIAQDPDHQTYFWDQRAVATGSPDGLLALYWTHDRSTGRDLNVHLTRQLLTEDPSLAAMPRDTGLRGQIAAPLLTVSGILFALVVDRGLPGTITLFQSSDFGAHWHTAGGFLIYAHDETAAVTPGHQHVDFAKYWEDMGKWSFGHPAICALPEENTWLTAWYAGTPDAMSIHWARIESTGLEIAPT